MRTKKICAAVLAAVLATGSTAAFAAADEENTAVVENAPADDGETAATGEGEGETVTTEDGEDGGNAGNDEDEEGGTEAATEVATLAALKTALEAGKTNITITGTIDVNEDITLTGVTLTAAATGGTWANGCIIKMTGGKITGGTINGNGRDLYVVNVASGTAVLENVTVNNQQLTNAGYPASVTAHSTIRNNGSLTLTGCTVKSGNPAAVKNEEDTTLNVTGGSITGKEIGITNWGTTTLDGGAEVKSESGSTAIYALTWDGYEGKTTVKDATVNGTIVYGGNSATTKTPVVEIEAEAVLVNSGFELAGNADMNGAYSADPTKKPTLTIDPDANVQLASTTDLDPVLVEALRDVKNITDSNDDPIEVAEDGTVAAKQFDITVAAATNGTVTVSPEKAAPGTEVTITATPNEGYEVDAYSVETAARAAVPVTGNKFIMPSSPVTVTVTFKAATTSDPTTSDPTTSTPTTSTPTTSTPTTSTPTTSTPTSSGTTSTDNTSSDNTSSDNTSSDNGNNGGNGSGSNANPSTGIALGVFPALLAAGAVIVIAKKRK